ncbi:MAG: polyprenyl synthetase family protein [Pseudomonadota bacterium]
MTATAANNNRLILRLQRRSVGCTFEALVCRLAIGYARSMADKDTSNSRTSGPSPDNDDTPGGTAVDPKAHFEALAASISRDMDQLLVELKAPERLVASMRHALLAGGKRLRPVLVLEVAHLLTGGTHAKTTLPPGAPQVAMALECIHTYSLIHDDLPSMDDDDLRRGQPAVHKEFDEATAILAGDALLTLAFEVVATCGHPKTAMMVRDLARAAGADGMVGGQVLDLAAEGRFGEALEIKDTYALAAMQAMKTGALIEVACVLGAHLALAPEAEMQRVARFGQSLGLAFQISDDLLDVRSNAEEAGKQTGKDGDAGKTTWPGLLGEERAQETLDATIADALATLEPYGDKAMTLRFLVESQRNRRA